MTFRQVNGVWQRVESQEPTPLTLAECLRLKQIIIDDDTQFYRIIKNFGKFTEYITYRVYGGTITICINTYKE